MTSGETSDDEILTVIIPCLNEEASIRSTVEEVYAEEDKLPLTLKVLMCDDGSTDRTPEIMRALCERYESCEVMTNPQNMGVGATVTKAYNIVTPGSWITVLPGDGEIVFASIHNHLAVRGEADLILGYLQNPVIRTTQRRLGSRAYNMVANFLYGFEFRYFNGFKMYKVETFKDLPSVSTGHAITVELIAKAVLRNPGLRIAEVPFVWRVRHARASHAFKPSAIVTAMQETLTVYRSVSEYRDQIYREAAMEDARRDEPRVGG